MRKISNENYAFVSFLKEETHQYLLNSSRIYIDRPWSHLMIPTWTSKTLLIVFGLRFKLLSQTGLSRRIKSPKWACVQAPETLEAPFWNPEPALPGCKASATVYWEAFPMTTMLFAIKSHEDTSWLELPSIARVWMLDNFHDLFVSTAIWFHASEKAFRRDPTFFRRLHNSFFDRIHGICCGAEEGYKSNES